MLAHDNAPGSGTTKPVIPVGGGEHFGVVVLAQSAERYERQHWNKALPWQTYGEKWEGGQMVTRNWLAGNGHLTDAPADHTQGGGK